MRVSYRRAGKKGTRDKTQKAYSMGGGKWPIRVLKNVNKMRLIKLADKKTAA